MKLLRRGSCCCKQTRAHPHHLQRASGLAVGRLPRQLILSMTQSLPMHEMLARSMPPDYVWGGLTLLMAEMCRPEVIALVLESSGVEVKQALIVCLFFFCLFIYLLNERICLEKPTNLPMS